MFWMAGLLACEEGTAVVGLDLVVVVAVVFSFSPVKAATAATSAWIGTKFGLRFTKSAGRVTGTLVISAGRATIVWWRSM